MYIQELKEILQRKYNRNYVNNIYLCRKSLVYYLMSPSKNDFDYIALNVNKRIVAIYNYESNTLIVESKTLDKNEHAKSCYDKKTARELNKFIDFINEIGRNHEKYNYKVINLVYFDYYLDYEYTRLVDNL